MSDGHLQGADRSPRTDAFEPTPRGRFGLVESVDLRLLGIHLALLPPAVYAFAQLGLAGWRGAFVVLVVYLVSLLCVRAAESDVT